jgi:hypothetical protein
VVRAHNKQLERTVNTQRGDTARAPFHYARAVRFMRQRAAAQLRRYTSRETSMPFFYLAIFLALICGAPWCKAEDSRSVTINGVAFAMPLPAGYVDLCESDEDAKPTFPSAIPPENAFLGCYTTPADLAEWQQGTGGVFSSYLIATVMKGTIRGNVSAAQFAAFSQNLKKSLNDLASKIPPSISEQIDRASASLSAKYKAEIRTTLEAITPIGAFDEGSDRVSTVWLVNATHEIDDQSIDDWQVQISSTVLVRGRAFVLFTYGKFDGPKDVERYKAIAQEWVSKLREANR